MIRNQVKEKKRQEDLIAIAKELQDIERINFYTDGSLYKEIAPQRTQMGAEWVAITKLEKKKTKRR